MLKALNRAIIFYVIFLVLILLGLNQTGTYLKINLITLNRLRPNSDYLLDLTHGRKRVDQRQLRNYIYYYGTLVRFVKNKTPALGILGLCYYYLGDYDKARHLYEKAIKEDPRFFWFYNNLGLIYFKQGQHRDAVKIFREAIAANPDTTLKIMRAEKTYRLMLFETDVNSDYKAFKKMKVYYTHCYHLLVLSYEHLGDYTSVYDVAHDAIAEELPDQGFFLYYAGLGQLKMGNLPRAIYYLTECIKQYPHYTKAYAALVTALTNIGQQQKAQQILIMRSQLDPTKEEPGFDPNTILPQIF